MASINFSQLEDANSEAIIRAYKKKKAELEKLRDQLYRNETEMFTTKQSQQLLTEDNAQLKDKLSHTEKQLKMVQMREYKRQS